MYVEKQTERPGGPFTMKFRELKKLQDAFLSIDDNEL